MEYPKEYLGDGVYAIFDGYGIWLHANDHKNPTDRIYLESPVYDALVRFDQRVRDFCAARAEKTVEEVCTK